MDKDNKTLGLGATVYVQGDPPPLIMQLNFFANNVCPEGLTDQEKAHWVMEEARKMGEASFQNWKSEIFDKIKPDRTKAAFAEWATNQLNELYAFENGQKTDRHEVESEAFLANLISEFEKDRLKDGSSIIDWSRPSTPFGWARRFAPYFKANLCIKLLISVIEDNQPTENQTTRSREKQEVSLTNFEIFDQSLFKSKNHLEATLTALQELELINSENQWLGKKTELVTLKEVLVLRSYINDEIPKSDAKLVPLLAQFFKKTISDRATRTPPKNNGELKRDLIKLLPNVP